MTGAFIWLSIGIFIGANFGFLACALMVAGASSDCEVAAFKFNPKGDEKNV